MNLKHILLLIMGVMISLIILLSISQNNEDLSRSSFLDDLLAAVLGHGSSQETRFDINCTPEFINFNISLNKGEVFNYTEILFDEDAGNVQLNSSYFVVGEEYKNEVKCYNIKYKKQVITSSHRDKTKLPSGKEEISWNITIGEDNGTFLVCESENISCKDYLLINYYPFFGLLNENFSIRVVGKTHYMLHYGVYRIEGDFYPKTEMKVEGKEKFNGRYVYVVKITQEGVDFEKKSVKSRIFSTSYLWIDIDKGVIVKMEKYLMGKKFEELKLVS